MASERRARKRARREAAAAAAMPSLTDDDLEALLVEVTVRADCDHASTHSNRDGGLVLLRCAVGVSVRGACPVDCPRFEGRRIGGLGL